MNRIIATARMQLVNTQTFIWVPLIVIGGAFVINWLIFAIVAGGLGQVPERGDSFTGASQAPLWYFLVIGVQSLTLTFPFSQAMSVARRTFFLGTALVTAAAGALLATLYTLLRIPEMATNGWGVGAYMFNVRWVTDGPWYEGWLFFFALTLLFFVIGFWAATVYKRFGTLVITVILTALALAVIGVIALITWQRWWMNVGLWLDTLTPLSTALWVLVVTVVLGASSYLTLRRAVP